MELKEIIEGLPQLTPNEVVDLFNHIEEHYCLTCGESFSVLGDNDCACYDDFDDDDSSHNEWCECDICLDIDRPY